MSNESNYCAVQPRMPPHAPEFETSQYPEPMKPLPTIFDHNKNSLALKNGRPSVPSKSPQHFSMPWFAEAPRIPPSRPQAEHAVKYHSLLTDYYYHHHQSIPTCRPLMYNPSLIPQQGFLREYAAFRPKNFCDSRFQSLRPHDAFSIGNRFMAQPTGLSQPTYDPTINKMAVETKPTDTTKPVEATLKTCEPCEAVPKTDEKADFHFPSPTQPSLKPFQRMSPVNKNKKVTFDTKLPKGAHAESPYHSHFQKGALVLIGTRVKKVEDLKTEDFFEAAKMSEDLSLDPAKVVDISPISDGLTCNIAFHFSSRDIQITVSVPEDHPFYVLHNGWSSANPVKTHEKYDLEVRQLQRDDLCVSLTKKVSKLSHPNRMSSSSAGIGSTLSKNPPELAEKMIQKTSGRKRRWSDPGRS